MLCSENHVIFIPSLGFSFKTTQCKATCQGSITANSGLPVSVFITKAAASHETMTPKWDTFCERLRFLIQEDVDVLAPVSSFFWHVFFGEDFFREHSLMDPVKATVEKPSTLLQERLRTAAKLERIHRYESQREGHPCRKMEDDGSYSPDIAESSHGDGFLMGWSDLVYFFQPTRGEDVVTQVGPAFSCTHRVSSCNPARLQSGSVDRRIARRHDHKVILLP